MKVTTEVYPANVQHNSIQITAFNKALQATRQLGSCEGVKPGLCLVFLAGIHGNEPSGVFAFEAFFKEFNQLGLATKMGGSFFGVAGNLQALAAGKRYLHSDLNRIWTPDNLRMLQHPDTKPMDLPEDFIEQKELFDIINHLLQSRRCPFMFIDMHTTSAPTLPFVTINDTTLNRKLAGYYPIPTVLGIEEYLEGTIMDYINDLGLAAIGFEAGQHDDPESVALHKAAIWVTLVESGNLEAGDVPGYKNYRKQLRNAAQHEADSIYEVFHRKEVVADEEFEMTPGYQNFDVIKKNDHLAKNKTEDINALDSGKIFMPLYQKQGSEGFFIIRKISPFWLWLSTYLRRLKTDRFLAHLPGIRFKVNQNNVLEVNRGIARFFSARVLHLLGYRRIHREGKIVYFTKREIAPGNRPFYMREKDEDPK